MGGRSGQSINNSGGGGESLVGGSMSFVENKIRSQNFESAALYDKDGKQTFFVDGQSSTVKVDNEQYKDFLSKSKGAIFTHNHPSGGSFSGQDVYTLMTTGLSEMRAVGSGEFQGVKLEKITYSLKINGKQRKKPETIKKDVKTIFDLVQSAGYKVTNNKEDFIKYTHKTYREKVKQYLEKNGFEYNETIN